VNLGRTYYLAQPSGGIVPSTWTVSYSAVTQVTLEPGRAAILLLAQPAKMTERMVSFHVFRAGVARWLKW